MILKPFMLRRIKKDVENELSDKVQEGAFFTAHTPSLSSGAAQLPETRFEVALMAMCYFLMQFSK